MSIVADWKFTADGNGTGQQISQVFPLELEAVGTFGSGTVTLEQLGNDGATWYAISGVSISADGTAGVLRLAPQCTFRAVLSGSTSPDLTVTLQEVI